MITNERQYRITKAQLKKFDEGLAAQAGRERNPDVDPRIHDAMGGALKSEADELRRQLREYERLREGRIKSRKLDSLTDLPRALIEARIAGHVTQKVLADRVGVPEQQVQRWEATGYGGVSVERLQDVVDALRVKLAEKVSFVTPRSKSARGGRSSRAAGITRPPTARSDAKKRSTTPRRSSPKRNTVRSPSSARATSGRKASTARGVRARNTASRRA